MADDPEIVARNNRIIEMRRAGIQSPEIGEREGLTTPYVIKLLSKLRSRGHDIPRGKSGTSLWRKKPDEPMPNVRGMLGSCTVRVYSRDLADAKRWLAVLTASE